MIIINILELLPKELVSGMSLQVADLDKIFPCDFAKIRNNRGKIIEKYEINKNNPIMIRSGKFPSPLLYIKKEEVFPLKKTTFEGYEFFIPNNSDEYLKILYGDDYMTLPPKNKRHTHADSIEIYESTK